MTLTRKLLAGVLLTFGLGSQALGAEIWSQTLTLRLVLREGSAWVSSPQLPPNCSPLRARIRLDTDYGRALYEFALLTYSRDSLQGRDVQVLVDDAVSDCEVLGFRVP
jgi:hypothetical protein